MDFQRLFDLFDYQLLRFPNPTALSSKTQGKWKSYATYECTQYIQQVSTALLRMGLQRGDKAAIIAKQGSPIWNFLDLGMQQIGVVVVPLHATAGENELLHILKEAEVKCCFVGQPDLYATILQLQIDCPDLTHVIAFEPFEGAIQDLSSLLHSPTEEEEILIQQLKADIQEKDLATIIYTSGTTGVPKGVMLSHRNIVSNIKATITIIPINYEKRTLSFLPLSHIMERMVTYTCFAVGASVHYGEGQDRLIENLKEVRPHYFTAVPLILERLLDRMRDSSKKGPFWKKRLFKWAVGLGQRYHQDEKLKFLYWFELLLADVLVFSKWRKALGGQVEGISVGAAALKPEWSRLFSAAGLSIREGYGLTETSPVIAFNRYEPGGVKFGTVGIPIPGIEVRIDQPNEEGVGEVQVKGPNVMLGYYNNEAATKAMWTEDGWFRTGDLGQWEHKRFLQLYGRRDDLFKTGAGKFIVPEVVEREYRLSPYIAQIVVTGANQAHLAALIVPDFGVLEHWCLEHNVHWTAPQFMVINPKVVQFFKTVIDQVNLELPPYQQVKHFALLHDPWTEESGELTPTLKLRRKKILQKNEQLIHELYN